MKPQPIRARFPIRFIQNCLVILYAVLILPGDTLFGAMQSTQAQKPTSPPPAAGTTTQPSSGAEAAVPPEQLDSLVAPIALYPDPLLAQTLAASTYPLEIVQLQQFLGQNKNLKDKALTDAVMKQDWDPSVQSMAAFP